jgi:AcrR family transcriptional regulator
MAAPADDAQPRTPLTRRRALEAAVAVADTEGLGALTMRRLARELGVEAMSLYHHVTNKDDILDGMVEQVFGEIDLPRDDAPWREAMLERGASVRAALTRHPWAISIMESRTSPGPATLRHHDAVLGACRRAGFSVAMAAHAFSLMDSYIYGFVLQEVNLPFDESTEMGGAVAEILPTLGAEEYPHLTELTVQHVLAPGYRYGDEFPYGADPAAAQWRRGTVGSPSSRRPAHRPGRRCARRRLPLGFRA